MTDRCPKCTLPVIKTPNGLLLDPTPDQVGIIRADGSRFMSREIQARGSRHRGHHEHECPKPRQGDLFGGDVA